MSDNQSVRLQELAEALSEVEDSLKAFAFRVLEEHAGLKPNGADLEDLLSTAFFEAAKIIQRDKDLRIRKYAAWFRQILFFSCLRFARDKRNCNTVNIDLLEAEASIEDQIHRQRESGRSSAEIEEALELLSEENQKILRLSAAGFTSEEIAKDMELSPATVRQKKSRAIKQLRKRLYDED